MTVDRSGNIYIADALAQDVVEIPINGSGQTTVAAGLGDPVALATDVSGDLFIADETNGDIDEVPVGESVTTVVSGLDDPAGVAVDSQGNLFVSLGGGQGSVVEFPTNNGSEVNIGTGYSNPTGLAEDDQNNLYIADGNNSRVQLSVPGEDGQQSDGTVSTDIARLGVPDAVSVDGSPAGSGDTFVADPAYQQVYDFNPNLNEIAVVAGTNSPGGCQGDPDGVAVFDPPPAFIDDSPPPSITIGVPLRIPIRPPHRRGIPR